jgi:hypothetical protein
VIGESERKRKGGKVVKEEGEKNGERVEEEKGKGGMVKDEGEENGEREGKRKRKEEW